MINSIYSNNEIFLRELISNASDAIDKYRFQALNSKGEIPLKDFEINIKTDKKKRTITITDNGIGMTKAEQKKSNSQGIKNALSRFEFLLNAATKVSSMPGQGTSIIISIPKAGK